MSYFGLSIDTVLISPRPTDNMQIIEIVETGSPFATVIGLANLMPWRQAYLEYRHHERVGQEPLLPPLPDGSASFPIEVIDLFREFSDVYTCHHSHPALGCTAHVFQMLPGDIHVNAALIRHGFLGCAPLMPSVSFLSSHIISVLATSSGHPWPWHSSAG